MKRLLLTCALVSLAAPAAASTKTYAGGGDGTLLLKDGVGKVTIATNRPSGVIGRFDEGTIVVTDPNPDDNISEVVTGADRTRVINEFKTRYIGKNVRFRYIGGRFTIQLSAQGIDLSAVGRGSVTLMGKGTDDDGTYSLNGATPQPLPLLAQVFPLGAAISTG